MGFNLREFFEELLYLIEVTHNGQEDQIIEYILDQAEYARDCGVIE